MGAREEVAKSINEQRENPDYLPGIELSPSVSATHDVEEALAGADMMVLATPSPERCGTTSSSGRRTSRRRR